MRKRKLPSAALGPSKLTGWAQPTLAQALRLAEPPPPLVTLPRQPQRKATPSGRRTTMCESDSDDDGDDGDDGGVLVVDLFSGIGGWSEGSRQAGRRVVLAVDYCEPLLRIHAKNHPACQHVRMELGPDTEEQLVAQIRKCVPAGRKWHLHASPPCTALSLMRNGTRSRDVQEGVRLVLWYLSLVLRLEPTTWSMEEVGTAMLDGVLVMARHLHPKVVAFASDVPFDRYGVPQTRKRTLAGTPALIRRFESDPSLREDAPVLSAVLEPPEGATIVKAAAGKCVDPERTVVHEDGSVTNDTNTRCMKSVHELCYTCLAGNPHYWCRPDFTTIRRFNMREQATLQCFPPEYKLGAIGESITGAGNAVPCLIARKFMAGIESD